MTETGQAITAAVWLAYTLLLLLRWMREGMRKDNGTDALQGQAGGRTGQDMAAEKRYGACDTPAPLCGLYHWANFHRKHRKKTIGETLQ